MMRKLSVLVMLVAACGGKSKSQSTSMPGTTHTPETEHINSSASQPFPDAGVVFHADAAPPPPPVTFELKNSSADTDLSFPNDKGWQTTFLTYTGKPPHAVTALFFPTPCTASCDASDPCPVCPEPATDADRKKAEQEAAAKRTTIKAGNVVDIPWDGKLYNYQKSANGKCKCWTKADAPADTYTIKVSGFRPSAKAGEPSARPSVEQTLVLPAPPASKVTFDFTK
jgi:hypothetical protein